MEILLVEDNSADAYLLTEIFARKEHPANISWVIDGHHALDYVFQRNSYEKAIRPDLILLDLNMPRINGYEVLKEIKENPTFRTIPVIILTTSRNPLDYTQCKTLGADVCLSKPYGLSGYDDVVRNILSMAMTFSKPRGKHKTRIN